MLTEYQSVIENLRHRILESKNPNEILLLAKLYGNMRWRNHDGVYHDEELEKFILDLVIKEIDVKHLENKFGSNTFATVIASELYNYGGHTKVVIKWLKLMSPFFSHKLIITRSIPKSIKKEINSYDVNIHKCKFSGIEKIKEIIKIAKGSKFVILHIHPDDIIASIASKILSRFGSTIVFYNHADHVFSYAVSSADIVCEISRFGMELSKRTGRVKGQQCWLGIPIFSRKKVKLDSLRKKFCTLKGKPEKIILSCGSVWKYKPDENISFDQFIDALLQQRKDVRFIIIGPTGKEKWWYKTKTRWKDYVKFTGPLSYKEYEDLLKKADVYIDSFPVTGGTAFPEALLAGVPCVGLELPIKGYNCADSLRVKDIKEAVKRIEQILDSKEDIFNLMSDTLNKLIKFNSEEAFKDRLFKLYSLEINEMKTVPCSESKKEIDCFWLEKLWKKEKKVLLPSLEILSNFSYYERIKILKILSKVRNYTKTNDFLKVLIATIVGRKYKSIKKLKNWINIL